MKKMLVLLLASLSTGLMCCGGEPPKVPELDRFGGWKAKQFEATGFFRTEHDGERWWLVTPEGNAFLSLGINHYHPGWWMQDENRDHWVKAFGAKQPGDDAWRRGFRDEAVRDCRHLGLNTFGYHCETPILLDPPLGPVMPYVRHYVPVAFSLHMRAKPEAYVDVFDPSFAEHCDRVAREQVKPYADDPLILGFAMADVPTMTDSEAQWNGLPTWPRVLRNMGADAPGKRAYVATMRERHNEIGTFNSSYGTAFDSWDALRAAEDWRPKTDMANKTERADNMAFLRECVDTYYRVAKEALRRYDTNHMFFGDKTNANGDAFDNIADIAARYCDATYFQSYGRWSHEEPRYDRWSAMTGLPLINGDSSYGAPKQHMPNPGGTKVRDEAERAAATREFCENAFARPDFVGWHICGILEMWDTMPGQQQRQKIGLKSPTGEFCPEITATVQDISARLYQIATSTADSRKRRVSQPAEVARKPSNLQTPGDDAQFDAWVAPFLQQLDLTDEQRPKFLALQRQMTQKWAEFQRMPPQERHAKQGAYYQARHAEMAKLLTKDQMAKYLVIRASPAGRTSPRKPEPTQGRTDAPLPSTPPDYSGKDLLGIESIAEEAEGGGEPWRQQADRRIDELRKADLEIRVVDASGNPLSGVSVHVEQRRHAFRFGGIVGGPSMHEPAPGQKPRKIAPGQYKKMYL